jgi:hypothetical protein
MKKAIKNIELILASIEFAKTEESANYVMSDNDEKILQEALDEVKKS